MGATLVYRRRRNKVCQMGGLRAVLAVSSSDHSGLPYEVNGFVPDLPRGQRWQRVF